MSNKIEELNRIKIQLKAVLTNIDKLEEKIINNEATGKEITKAEAARRIGVSSTQINRLIKRGDLRESPTNKIFITDLLNYQRGRSRDSFSPAPSSKANQSQKVKL